MCLAVPGKIVKLDKDKAVVDFSGLKRTVDVSFLENPMIGEFVLVHVGFAIQKIDEETAKENYRLFA